MNECFLYPKLVVSGADIEEVNGDYYSSGRREMHDRYFTVYTKDGVVDGYPRIEPVYDELYFVGGAPPDTFSSFNNKSLRWYIILSIEEDVVYNRTAFDWSPPEYSADSPISEYNCSVVGEYFNNFGIPGPSVTGSADYIADRNGKYTTATESGANRFRRLNSLGYV